MHDARMGRESGHTPGFETLLPVVYDELRAIAHGQLRRERADHTLCTTALVHEAYVRLADQRKGVWADRTHFFAIAARAMRRVLIDYARRHIAARRGGASRKVALNDAAQVAADDRADELIVIDEALQRLSRLDARQARVIEYRFFGGMTESEVATALGVTARTVRRDWVRAKAWLMRELNTESGAVSADEQQYRAS